jgi:hypothetical protein
MKNTYESWFTKKVNGMANTGITIKGITYHGYPVRVCKCGAIFSDGLCPECDRTADWRKTDCKKDGCKSRNAFVFQTNEDPDVFFIFCQKCNKFDIVDKLPASPAKFVSNAPPIIGSKTKPTPEQIEAYKKSKENV